MYATVEEYMLMGYQSIAVGIFYATIWDWTGDLQIMSEKLLSNT